MRRISKNLLGDILSIDLKEEDKPRPNANNKEDKETKETETESTKLQDENGIEVLISGSPSYPRIFWGESAKPLVNGPFPETEYIDDNIHSTYRGLISFLG